MPQSLILLPERANIRILGWGIEIREHKVVGWGGLWGRIINIIEDTESHRGTLYQLEKHGLGYEAAIEWCARELEDNAYILAQFIYLNYNTDRIREMVGENVMNIIHVFSKGVTGRKMADQFTEKIRSCENWQELYDELHPASKFNLDMKNKITVELKRQCLRV